MWIKTDLAYGATASRNIYRRGDFEMDLGLSRVWATNSNFEFFGLRACLDIIAIKSIKWLISRVGSFVWIFDNTTHTIR